MQKNIASIRLNYTLGSLDESDVGNDPYQFFDQWLNQAIASELTEPTAMVLSTLDPEGAPDSRVVLLKGFNNEGFTFYTNYNSRKGVSLALCNKASLLFFWPELQRQVRISGLVNKTSREESELYFSERPRESQLGAWASNQSEPVESREYLEKRYKTLEQEFGQTDIPIPPHWGGYTLSPMLFEFWQGRPGRLHDRIRMKKSEKGWASERLAP